MTAQPETVPESYSEEVDGVRVASTGAAPHAPTWATSSNYDWPFTYHRREGQFRNGHGEIVLEIDTIVETSVVDGEVKVAEPVVYFETRDLPEIALTRPEVLQLIRELCIVLEVDDIGPLMAPEILDGDPYLPAKASKARKRNAA